LTQNACSLIGNLGDDPELRYTPNGQAVANFSMAVTQKFGEKEETTWVKVVCWRDLAENVSESLRKGNRVMVIGRIQVRQWETEDGQKRSAMEVNAEAVGPELRWATAEVTRNERKS